MASSKAVKKKRASAKRKTSTKRKVGVKRPIKKKTSTKKKTVAKRVAVKKKTVSKAKKKTTSHPVKKNAESSRMFILVNGKKLKNVKELADIMDELEDYVFHHHVTHDRNDFARWLHDVFKEIDLAKQLAGAKDKKHVQLVLYRHISHKLW